MKTKKNTKQESKTLIYCGPQLPNLQKHTIFKSSIPKYLEDDINSCSAIKHLCVAPSELANVRAKVNIKGTRENTLYNQIKQYIRGE